MALASSGAPSNTQSTNGDGERISIIGAEKEARPFFPGVICYMILCTFVMAGVMAFLISFKNRFRCTESMQVFDYETRPGYHYAKNCEKAIMTTQTVSVTDPVTKVAVSPPQTQTVTVVDESTCVLEETRDYWIDRVLYKGTPSAIWYSFWDNTLLGVSVCLWAMGLLMILLPETILKSAGHGAAVWQWLIAYAPYMCLSGTSTYVAVVVRNDFKLVLIWRLVVMAIFMMIPCIWMCLRPLWKFCITNIIN